MVYDPSDSADSGTGEGDLFLVRFDEVVPPSDLSGTRTDATPVVVGQVPSLVEEEPPLSTTVKGRARQFSPGYAYQLSTLDEDAWSALASFGLAAIVWWDFDAQVASGVPRGVIAQQGGSAPAQAPEVSLEVVDPFNRIGRLRIRWKQGANEHTGYGEFVVPTKPFVVCASRELDSPAATFLVRLFAAGADLGQTTLSAKQDSDTEGLVTVGCGQNGAVFENYFCGVIDCVHAVARPIVLEEAELLHWFVGVAGPAGYISVRDRQASTPQHPGAQPTDPSSWFQRELMVEGAGFALAKRNFRRLKFFLPHLAWGSWLKVWEDALELPPRPGDTVQERRDRASERLRSVLSMSRTDIRTQLAEALGYSAAEVAAGKPTIIENDDEYADDMTVLVKTSNLYTSGHAHTAWLRDGKTHTTFTSPTGPNPYLQFDQTGTDDLRYTGWSATAGSPFYMRYVGAGVERQNPGVDGDSAGGKRVYARGEIRSFPTPPTTGTNDFMIGIVLGSIIEDHWAWFGLRYTGAQYDLVALSYAAGVLDTSFTVLAANVGVPARFVEVRHKGDGHNDLGKFGVRQAATVGGLPGATEYEFVSAVTRPEWAGYAWAARGGASAIGGPTTARFGAWWEKAHDAERHMSMAVYRNPADNANTYDVLLANEILQACMLADRSVTVIDRQTGLSYDHANARLDRDPLEH